MSMCGITGFIQFGNSVEDMKVLVRHMADKIAHRGPDDSGVWVDAECGIALGHRRLSIVDLTFAGHQPMRSSCGRYILAFNGEIYNHLELRMQLDRHYSSDSSTMGPNWRGHSDTETLLAGIIVWGLEDLLQRCVGMFAFALWDVQTNELTLVRDRFGEQPLYYGWIKSATNIAFVFGSELKAIKAFPGFKPRIDRQALSQYFSFNYVPAPLSIYEGVFKLEPGCLLTIKKPYFSVVPLIPIHRGQSIGQIAIKEWWSACNSIEKCMANQFTDDVEAVATLEEQLNKSVCQQSIADVPVGTFLSGGIDSSAITAILQKNAGAKIKTYTIGFDDESFDESKYACAVAKHLGTDHHEIKMTPKMAWELVPNLSSIYDEPFADSSQIPTYLVCNAARKNVTVALSGDGGDELFGGYNRYLLGPRIWKQLGWLPYSLRGTFAASIRSVPISSWNKLSAMVGVSRFGDKAYKFAQKMNKARSVDDLYWNLISEWTHTDDLVVGGVDFEHNTFIKYSVQQKKIHTILTPAERMMLNDTLTYLPDDILCKVDRAAMATGLETRVPFLDHRVFEIAWRMPIQMKIRGNRSKWALRQILYKQVPLELIERPKSGFSIPLGEWLRGPLLAWSESLLDKGKLKEQGYLNPLPVRKKWAEHKSGQFDHSASLWSVLMFQSWLQAQD